MNEEILIQSSAYETRVALFAHGALQEIHIERHAARGTVSNVYLGKVVRVLPGMQSAFIDIGLERAAFLHVADVLQAREKTAPGDDPLRPSFLPIERVLFDGQTVLVQVLKDPIGTKGARLTTEISLAGRMLVFLPQNVSAQPNHNAPYIGISQKIEAETEREELRTRLESLLPPNQTGGFIVRTSALLASDAELSADIHYLHTLWQQLAHLSQHQPAPKLLHQDLSLVQRVARDMAGEHTVSIRTEDAATLQHLREFAEIYSPSLLNKIALYQGERGLFDVHQVDEEINRALSRRVDLKSGGYLIIDQNEAMTTVDVNTGGFVGARNLEDTIFRTNLEATQAIARQLRLRNLGGIIILDFIDMVDAAHRESVLAEFKRALARDHTRVTVNDFSPLGLVEMTRKRTRESLAHVLCQPCAVCAGIGEVKTARTVCYEILREIAREARQFSPREFRILASEQIVDLFLEEESQHLAQLIDDIGKPISLQVDKSLAQSAYDIVLL